MAEELITALSELKREEALAIVREKLESGVEPFKVMDDARRGMEIVGERFASGKYFLPELIFSGEILKGVTNLVKPELGKGTQRKTLGKVIIGTVAGDIHDIGKDIVTFMLEVNGFQVYDLGVDLPALRFVDKIKETDATIIGLSGFLTLAFDSMKETIEAIKSAGLRDKVKVMIGGGQVDERIKDYTGADAYGKDAMAAVLIAKKWIGG